MTPARLPRALIGPLRVHNVGPPRVLPQAHPGLVLDESLSFEAAVNGACAILPVENAVRQTLLELDDLLERHKRAAAIMDEILGRVLRLKSMRGRDEGESGLN